MRYYVHSVPGRLRVMSPNVKRDEVAACKVDARLRMLPGVIAVAVKPLTGSIVVEYNTRQISDRSILEILERDGYFDLSNAVTIDQCFRAVATEIGGVLCGALFGAVGEYALGH